MTIKDPVRVLYCLHFRVLTCFVLSMNNYCFCKSGLMLVNCAISKHKPLFIGQFCLLKNFILLHRNKKIPHAAPVVI